MFIFMLSIILFLSFTSIILLIRNTIIYSVRVKAINSWSQYSKKIFNYTENTSHTEKFYSEYLHYLRQCHQFHKFFDQLPSYSKMILSLFSWNYNSLTKDYEDKLKKHYEYIMNAFIELDK